MLENFGKRCLEIASAICTEPYQVGQQVLNQAQVPTSAISARKSAFSCQPIPPPNSFMPFAITGRRWAVSPWSKLAPPLLMILANGEILTAPGQQLRKSSPDHEAPSMAHRAVCSLLTGVNWSLLPYQSPDVQALCGSSILKICSYAPIPFTSPTAMFLGSLIARRGCHCTFLFLNQFFTISFAPNGGNKIPLGFGCGWP